MTEAFTLHQVSVRLGHGKFSDYALRDIDLQIQSGERIAFIGANGCGKSTLLRLLHGLVPPSSGSLHSAAGLAQAMVFQRPHLLRMSAQANVALGLWLRGHHWSAARCLASEALQQVGLGERALLAARTLSSGQQQRVALARALALRARVLLLDEPTSSLDPPAMHEVEALLQGLASADPGMTLLFASHNLGQVQRLATRVVYLEQGSILADLPVQQFFAVESLRSHHPQAHAFVSGELPCP